MVKPNIEKYLGIIDVNETDFSDDEIVEIIDFRGLNFLPD